MTIHLKIGTVVVMTKTTAALIALVAILLTYSPMRAQGDYGSRLQGRNGWLLPVATRILGSDEQMHRNRGSVNAWDLVAPLGSAIYAMASGSVVYAGCNNAGGYGCWVLLQHANGFTSAYGHMISGSIMVKAGQSVDANTVLGQIGWTGKTSFGPHTHFEIRHSGAFQPIGNYFNVTAMKPCRLCSVQGKPVAAQGIVSTQGAPTPAPATGFDGKLFMTVIITCGLLFLFLNRVGRYALFFVVTVYAAIVTARTSAPVAATPTIGAGGWEQIYPILQSNEGWSCTHDPIRTMGGVTQGTYTAWRMSQGLGPADVCGSLTREQAKAIYYQRYWLASGANKLPLPLALTHVDHAINAGVSAANSILGQCGNNVGCYNNARITAYRSMNLCHLYCAGWLNRVNKIRKFTGG